MAKRKRREARGSPRRAPSARLRTEIGGLDAVLGGGLLRGRVYVVTGAAGTGKTVLSMQLAFNLARAGEDTVYVSALTESMDLLVSNVSTFGFFDPKHVGTRITLLSASRPIAEGGLPATLDFLTRAARESKASLLVIDSLAGFETLADSPQQIKRFFRDLGALAPLLRCTVVCIVPRETDAPCGPERLMSDGILELRNEPIGIRTVRLLEVLKSRGSAHLAGRHVTTITPEGMVVHPRREVLARVAPEPRLARRSKGRLSLGVATLDAMLSGGIVPGSSTAILGAPGAGKTLFGLQFLHAGAKSGEPGLYYGFFESPERLVAKARGVGLPFDAHLRSGAVELLWQPALEQPLDLLAERLFAAVERRKVRRLFIDGVDAFKVVTAFPNRLPRFLGALTADLRANGVTVVMSEETELLASQLAVPIESFSMIFDNIVLLRYVELGARVHRLVSILKVRESDYDSSAREFWISPRGLELAGSPESARAILSGGAIEPAAALVPSPSRPAGRRSGR